MNEISKKGEDENFPKMNHERKASLNHKMYFFFTFNASTAKLEEDF
jgi:hypothetical protein